ncbi:hypothetical protein EVAR_33139_1 [Eumeta japonica]|uniref:Uncharacterized protein n=1 Tax=Eumeta variegata TaxID=151549 RepID=A0A4C1Y738_EUMVA|nr:hypothetical protein EVAR_33139_1 [Eumeta japonica]
MRYLRKIYGVTLKCRNDDVRERCGLKEDVVTRVEIDGRSIVERFRRFIKYPGSLLSQHPVQKQYIFMANRSRFYTAVKRCEQSAVRANSGSCRRLHRKRPHGMEADRHATE